MTRKQVESALLGAIFDPYVRFIVWEGLREWWKTDLESWLACPADGDPFPHSSIVPVPPSAPAFADTFKGVTSFVMGLLPSSFATALSLAYPIPLAETENLQAGLLANHPLNRRLERQSQSAQSDEFARALGIPACPYTWSKPIHELNCDVVWPKEYKGNSGPLIELDTPEYLGRITQDKTVEKLLAMGGLRLASIVNTILGRDEEEKGLYFSY